MAKKRTSGKSTRRRSRVRRDDADSYESYKARLKIDRDDLENELIEQLVLFQGVCEHLVRANSRRDQAYDDRKAVIAESAEVWAEEFRAKHRKAPAVTVISTAIESMPAVMDARKAERLAAASASKWDYLRESFMQRSFVLRELARIHLNERYQSDNMKDAK